MDSSQSFAVILLAWNKNSNQRAFTSSFTTKHRDLDPLFHVLQDVAINWNLRHIRLILYALAYFLHHNLRILVPRHVKEDTKRLLHFINSNASAHPIIFNAQSVHSSAEAFIEPEDHLRGQMINPVQSGVV